MKKVLFIAAHPDDEILECGGTAAKYARDEDCEVHCVIVCEGESVRYSDLNVNQTAATELADKIIGYKSVTRLGFPDQHLDTFSLIELNRKIEKVCDELKPEIVYTHWIGDLNRDHQIIAESVSVALRPTADYLKEMYAFCNPIQQLPYSASIRPNVFVDIEQTLETKIKAFSAYTSEVRQWPHVRSLEAIEYTARATGSLCNRNAAECFYLVRRIM